MSGRQQLTDDPKALALLEQLDDVCAELGKAETTVEDTSRQRNRLFLQLRRLGVTQRQIADRAGISEPAVAKAIRKAEADEA